MGKDYRTLTKPTVKLVGLAHAHMSMQQWEPRRRGKVAWRSCGRNLEFQIWLSTILLPSEPRTGGSGKLVHSLVIYWHENKESGGKKKIRKWAGKMILGKDCWIGRRGVERWLSSFEYWLLLQRTLGWFCTQWCGVHNHLKLQFRGGGIWWPLLISASTTYTCETSTYMQPKRPYTYIYYLFFTGRWMERTNSIKLPTALHITHCDMYIHKHIACIYIITNKIFF